ncbi:MAG TPA: arylesterase [Blastocatellia bacterium]|jgi:acyl-CoA thioesterase-1|nr:arylesterase [Blastocatellia bacterium]
MVNRNRFTSFAGALLLAAFSVACQKSGAPDQSSAGVATSKSSFAPAKPPEKLDGRPVIVAFGDSLTAGFGLPEDQTFTTLLQRKIDENGRRYRVEDAGVSGDTSAGGVSRIDWALAIEGGPVKFLILELGGNDGLRALPVAEMKKNLAEIIERAQARDVTVILAGMEAPPNLGEEYTSEFRQAYRDLAKKYKVPLIPFLLEGVASRREMNQSDGIHPNAAGEKIMTENVWREIEPLLPKN